MHLGLQLEGDAIWAKNKILVEREHRRLRVITRRILKNGGASEEDLAELKELDKQIAKRRKSHKAEQEAWTAQCIYWNDKYDCRIVRLEAA